MGTLGQSICIEILNNTLSQAGVSGPYDTLYNAMSSSDETQIKDVCSKYFNTFTSSLYKAYSARLLSKKGYQANASLNEHFNSLLNLHNAQQFADSMITASKASMPSTSAKAQYLKNAIRTFLLNNFLYPLDDYASSLYTSSKSAQVASADITNSNNNPDEVVDTSVNSSIESQDESDYLTDEEYELYGYDDYRQDKQKTYDTESQKYSKIKTLRSVFGMPYQFLPDTDRRLFTQKSNGVTNIAHLDKDEYMGRKYIERIAQRANILFLTPGTVRFLKGASSKTKKRVIEGFLSNLENTASMQGLLNDTESYRYYSFDFDVQGYFQYLNPMIRAAARYLNLQDYTVDGKKASNVSLLEQTKLLTHANYYDIFANAAGTGSIFNNAYGALTFYVNGTDSTSDSISTSLSNSTFVDSYIKPVSDTAKELKFLAGKAIVDLTNDDWANNVVDEDTIRNSMTEIENFVNKYLGSNSFAKKLSLGAVTVGSGGQIIFPKIWSDTQFDADSQTINVKLTSPDCDDYSLFWNILVPMYSVICMAAPKGYVGIDGYSQPFMVRAFCQSMFNIECGYITGLSIRKGAEGCWTKSGLPTVMEISITITDVYESRYISTGNKPTVKDWWNPIQVINGVVSKTPFLKNTAMLNWIACTCGINVNKPDLIRDIEMYIVNSIENPILDILTNFKLDLCDAFRNMCPITLDIIGKV